MSDKETNLKEKLKQALASTIKVISDDLEIKQTDKKLILIAALSFGLIIGIMYVFISKMFQNRIKYLGNQS